MALVRVKLDNGMEASVPEGHAKASGLKVIDKPAVNNMGRALEATGAEDALAKRAEKAKAAKKTTAAKKTAAKKTAAKTAATPTPAGNGENA